MERRRVPRRHSQRRAGVRVRQDALKRGLSGHAVRNGFTQTPTFNQAAHQKIGRRRILHGNCAMVLIRWILAENDWSGAGGPGAAGRQRSASTTTTTAGSGFMIGGSGLQQLRQRSRPQGRQPDGYLGLDRARQPQQQRLRELQRRPVRRRAVHLRRTCTTTEKTRAGRAMEKRCQIKLGRYRWMPNAVPPGL